MATFRGKRGLCTEAALSPSTPSMPPSWGCLYPASPLLHPLASQANSFNELGSAKTLAVPPTMMTAVMFQEWSTFRAAALLRLRMPEHAGTLKTDDWLRMQNASSRKQKLYSGRWEPNAEGPAHEAFQPRWRRAPDENWAGNAFAAISRNRNESCGPQERRSTERATCTTKKRRVSGPTP